MVGLYAQILVANVCEADGRDFDDLEVVSKARTFPLLIWVLLTKKLNSQLTAVDRPHMAARSCTGATSLA